MNQYVRKGMKIMKFNTLKLKYFRCFEELKLTLDPKYTVLVGINGAGKSTILDALSIALGGYLAGFDGIRSNHIMQTDAHYKMRESGSRIDVQEQYPVIVETEAQLEDENRVNCHISWSRSLNGAGRRTTYGQTKEIAEYARGLQCKIRNGEACILPLVAYYGTGRLWMQKRSKRVNKIDVQKLKRQMGYIDCLDVASNEKQMMKWFEEMTYIQLQESRLVPELEAVKAALCQCYKSSDKEITDAKFFYNVKSGEMEIQIHKTYGFEKLPVRMLSDGEKGIISLVADIAYRMALLNPDLLDKVLDTPGIVLIDEIDMHLHPMWQKKIINDLITIFPNVQFVFTTHSPSVLANVPKEHIRVLDRYQLYMPQNNTYGRSIEDILREVMDVDVRPDDVQTLLSNFSQAIDCENMELAQKYLNDMRMLLGNDAKEVVESQISLDLVQI